MPMALSHPASPICEFMTSFAAAFPLVGVRGQNIWRRSGHRNQIRVESGRVKFGGLSKKSRFR